MDNTKKLTDEQVKGMIERLVELCEKSPAVKERLDDTCFESQTNLPPNSLGYAVLSDVREGLKTLGTGDEA